MSKRSTWCDFDKETRKYIKKRDNNECVYCHKRGALQIMHIFVSRAHGGKGCKENGVLGCIKCHQMLDNGNNTSEAEKIKQHCINYLVEHENIKDIKQLKHDLVYHKSVENNFVFKYPPRQFGKTYIQEKLKNENKITINCEKNAKTCEKKQLICKNCIFLVKSKYNSTIPKYYCKYKKILINKTTHACKKYVEEL